jgi:hypothetical protein
MTMRLRCVPFSKIDGHVTVDAERKILFWFNQTYTHKEQPMFNSLNLMDPESTILSKQMPTKDLKYDMLQSIACDFSIQKVFAAFYDPVDRNSHIYEITYRSANITQPKFLADFTHQITTIFAVQGNLFWYDKFSRWIHVKRPTSNRALKIRKIDEAYLRGSSAHKMELLNIASGYTHTEMGLQSLCDDSTCDYFCELFDTPSGPGRQCLCPVDSMDGSNQSFFKKCPEVTSDYQRV